MKNEKNIMYKFRSLLGLEDNLPLPTNQNRNKATSKNNQTISLAYFKKGLSEIKILSPKKYSDAINVANLLKEETSMIVNFQYLDKMSTKRFMDFISGTIYSLSGHMSNLADNIVLLTPEKTLINEDTGKSENEERSNVNEEIVVNLLNNLNSN